MDNKKNLLFSVTASDCDFIYQRGRGNGGQKKNKTNSACICTHKKSGAQGYSEDSRSQLENKQTAFKRMSETPEFKKWLKTEIAIKTGEQAIIDEKVENALQSVNIKVEVKNEKGLWSETSFDVV